MADRSKEATIVAGQVLVMILIVIYSTIRIAGIVHSSVLVSLSILLTGSDTGGE